MLTDEQILELRSHFPILREKTYLYNCSQGALSDVVESGMREYAQSWRMRMTGSSDPSAIFVAVAMSEFSRAASTCSIFCGSRLPRSRIHQKVRSPTTATATRAEIRIGHMTGPPLSKNWRTMFA